MGKRFKEVDLSKITFFDLPVSRMWSTAKKHGFARFLGDICVEYVMSPLRAIRYAYYKHLKSPTSKTGSMGVTNFYNSYDSRSPESMCL